MRGEAAWFDISIQKTAEHKKEQHNAVTCDKEYALTLESSASADNLLLRAVVREHIEYRDYHEIMTMRLWNQKGLPSIMRGLSPARSTR